MLYGVQVLVYRRSVDILKLLLDLRTFPSVPMYGICIETYTPMRPHCIRHSKWYAGCLLQLQQIDRQTRNQIISICYSRWWPEKAELGCQLGVITLHLVSNSILSTFGQKRWWSWGLSTSSYKLRNRMISFSCPEHPSMVWEDIPHSQRWKTCAAVLRISRMWAFISNRFFGVMLFLCKMSLGQKRKEVL